MERTFPCMLFSAKEIVISIPEARYPPSILTLDPELEVTFVNDNMCLKKDDDDGWWTIFEKKGHALKKRYFFANAIKFQYTWEDPEIEHQVFICVSKRIEGMERLYKTDKWCQEILHRMYMDDKQKNVQLSWVNSTHVLKVHDWMVQNVCKSLSSRRSMQSDEIKLIWYSETIEDVELVVSNFDTHKLFGIVSNYAIKWGSQTLTLWCQEKISELLKVHTIYEIFPSFIRPLLQRYLDSCGCKLSRQLNVDDYALVAVAILLHYEMFPYQLVNVYSGQCDTLTVSQEEILRTIHMDKSTMIKNKNTLVDMNKVKPVSHFFDLRVKSFKVAMDIADNDVKEMEFQRTTDTNFQCMLDGNLVTMVACSDATWV